MHRHLSVIALASSLSLASAGCLGVKRIEQALPPTFADLNTVQRVEIQDSGGQVLLGGTFSTASGTPGDVERTAELTAAAGGTPKGKAEIEIERSNGTTIEDEIEVSAEGLPAAASCKLMVDGQQVMTFTTTDKGKVDLKLSRKTAAR